MDEKERCPRIHMCRTEALAMQDDTFGNDEAIRILSSIRTGAPCGWALAKTTAD